MAAATAVAAATAAEEVRVAAVVTQAAVVPAVAVLLEAGLEEGEAVPREGIPPEVLREAARA